MGITEEGRLVVGGICEDGRVVIAHAITEDGRIVVVSDRFLFSSDAGVGSESLGSRAFSALDQGVGLDAISELSATLIQSDLGVGLDAISELSATLIQSDSGIGTDAVKKLGIYIYLLLKLLQEDEINIEISQ